MDDVILTQTQAEWLCEKIWKAFLESEVAESEGVKLAQSIIRECIPFVARADATA